MKEVVFVEFADATAFRRALDAARADKIGIVDAFTPFPIEGLGAALGGSADGSKVRLWMLIGGLGAAAAAYCLQLYSATLGYPFDVGGRPHNSWPTFILFPFEFGVLSAAIFGLLALFQVTGLPQLHHRLFDIDSLARVSNDRFVLALERPEKNRMRARLEERMAKLGALRMREAEL